MHAFVTLVSSDSYLPGALTQVAAISDLHTHPFSVCLVTPETLDVATIKALRKAFNLVVGVEILEQANNTGLLLLGRPDLTTVLTKLHVFRLTQFSKIIFLDADVLPIRPIDHLFSLPHEFSAVPDVGWPDIFNSGVMVLTPGEEKFAQLNQLLKTSPSWDGGDQGILNEWRGGDWNRLSFTYNTTPTAAYTYAPAYERYGSQISAIHFIGPNKPWNSIAYRPPFSPSHSSEDRDPQRAYDYQSLVDRWYDVYDRHYRIQSIPAQDQFEVKHYTSIWDAPPSESTPVDVHSLDDLRRLAIQGLNASAVSSNALPGEGQYKTLPLEGRFDLMRPKKQKPKEEHLKEVKQEFSSPIPAINIETSDQSPIDYFAHEPVPSTPLARHTHLNDDVNHWHTLPTPGPNECPASPQLHSISLPATPSPFPIVSHATPESHTSKSDPEPLLVVDPEPKHHKAQQQHEPHHQDSSQSPHQTHTVQEHEQHHERPRPSSPPLLSWNAAIEPPPNTTPTPNAFPVNTYFANIWDHTPSRHNDQSHTSPTTLPDSSGFFKPLPAPEIPESLIKQGHYRNVTGDSYLGATPSPDRSRVKSVFPWEEKPRVMPARIFPDSDAPSPSLFLSPSSQSQTSTTTVPSTPETKGPPRTMPLSPLYGLPTSFNYANAWDNIPSIQKYASMLVKAPPPPPPLAPAFDDNSYKKGRRKSWDERGEINSQDGDDEDNADEDEDPANPAGNKWDDNDADQEKNKKRSRSNSLLTRHRGKKKEYRQRGVQTMAVEKRSQSIQVDPPKPEGERHSAKRLSVSSKRHWAPATGSGVLPPAMTRDVSSSSSSDNALFVAASTGVGESMQKSPSVSPTSRLPLKSHRDFVVAPSPITSPDVPAASVKSRMKTDPSTLSSKPLLGRMSTSSSATSVPSCNTPTTAAQAAPLIKSLSPMTHKFSIISRQPSNDSSVGSPASSIGPLSPTDGQSVLSPMRKTGRVWDPARGVELFKRGSEEVLARFLKMGSWDESVDVQR